MTDLEHASDLDRIADLVGIRERPASVTAVRLEDLILWKPLVERLAFEQPAAADEAAHLVVRVAQATGDAACVALGSIELAANRCRSPG